MACISFEPAVRRECFLPSSPGGLPVAQPAATWFQWRSET